MSAIVQLKQLRKVYEIEGAPSVVALQNLDLEIHAGEFVAVMGPSGSGKSSLMHIIGLLDRASSGSYLLDGTPIGELSADALALLRSKALGFVFQAYNLLPRTSALENVELPMVYAGVPAGERREKALRALAAVGLAAYAEHNPNQLSGGQQQRVAIARSIVNSPRLILADEPTGALDSVSSDGVMRLLQSLNREQGITVMVVTHERRIAEYAQRILSFSDGVLVQDEIVSATPTAVSKVGLS